MPDPKICRKCENQGCWLCQDGPDNGPYSCTFFESINKGRSAALTTPTGFARWLQKLQRRHAALVRT